MPLPVEQLLAPLHADEQALTLLFQANVDDSMLLAPEHPHPKVANEDLHLMGALAEGD